MGRRNQAKSALPRDSRKWRVALYIRLSKEDGNDVSNSVIHQEQRLAAFLSAFKDDYILSGIYRDDGCTGTDTNRAEFQRMLKDIREHKVNCVIVKDLSRLSRNVTDATYYIENVFVEYDVRFISLELPALDSFLRPEQMNSILVPIQNVINDDFCRQTSIKVRGVFNQKRTMGQFIGAFAPYGFIKDPADKHRLLIDGEAASVVRDIFNWYVRDGVSMGAIVRKLNELRIPNPAAYKNQKGLQYKNRYSEANDALWNPKTVRNILGNEVYLGHMVQGRYRVKSYKVHTQIRTPREEWYVAENTHEPVVGRELFDMAQKLREKDTRQTPGQKTLYPLSGFVRCADCKKAMVRSQGGGKTKYSYYQCSTYRKKSREACTKHSIRADILEEAVFSALKIQIELISSFDAVADEISRSSGGSEPSRLSAMLSAREKEIAKILNLKDSLYADWKSGDLTGDDYRRMKANYEQQIKTLQEAAGKLREKRQAAEEGTDDPRLQTFLKHGIMEGLDRSAVVDFVDAVYVHANGAVEIAFRFRDQHKLVAQTAGGGFGFTIG
ncbi:MAG: recombinase family protein [Oscillospiraceae bacterium]|jgi:DNA invertase Pin-like site-specific DNA recombinase|nr:recombinase family protein [Oscillospiraceae bacterium]